MMKVLGAPCLPGAPFIISQERNELPPSLAVHVAKPFLSPSLGNKLPASASPVLGRKGV